jgi:hypothetical protein
MIAILVVIVSIFFMAGNIAGILCYRANEAYGREKAPFLNYLYFLLAVNIVTILCGTGYMAWTRQV